MPQESHLEIYYVNSAHTHITYNYLFIFENIAIYTIAIYILNYNC